MQNFYDDYNDFVKVTILILVDGFLQLETGPYMKNIMEGHNPYFSRWFSAILVKSDLVKGESVTILILVDGFLQYRWLPSNDEILYESQSLF